MSNFLFNLQNNSVMVTTALRSVIYAAVLFGWIHWTDVQIVGALGAMESVLVLFVRGNTVAAAGIEKRVDEKVALRELTGATGTSEGMDVEIVKPKE